MGGLLSYSGTQVVALIDGEVPWGNRCLGCAVLNILEDKTKTILHLYCLLCDVSISGRYIELSVTSSLNSNFNLKVSEYHQLLSMKLKSVLCTGTYHFSNGSTSNVHGNMLMWFYVFPALIWYVGKHISAGQSCCTPKMAQKHTMPDKQTVNHCLTFI